MRSIGVVAAHSPAASRNFPILRSDGGGRQFLHVGLSYAKQAQQDARELEGGHPGGLRYLDDPPAPSAETGDDAH